MKHIKQVPYLLEAVTRAALCVWGGVLLVFWECFEGVFWGGVLGSVWGLLRGGVWDVFWEMCGGCLGI